MWRAGLRVDGGDIIVGGGIVIGRRQYIHISTRYNVVLSNLRDGA